MYTKEEREGILWEFHQSGMTAVEACRTLPLFPNHGNLRNFPAPCAVLGQTSPCRARLSAVTVHGRETPVPEVRTVPPCTVTGRIGPHRAQSPPRALPACTVLGRIGPHRAQSLAPCTVTGQTGPYRAQSPPRAPPPCTVLGRMGPYRARLSAGTVHGREGLVPEVRTGPRTKTRTSQGVQEGVRCTPRRSERAYSGSSTRAA